MEFTTRDIKFKDENGQMVSALILGNGSVEAAVDDWLDNHPEVVTNVYVTPEMYGAKGDGVTDDTIELKTAFEHGGVVFLKPNATYLVTDLLVEDTQDLSVIGYGATIKVKKEFTFLSYLERCCLKLKNCSNVKFEGITFDANWDEIKDHHNFDVDTTLENYCVRLMGGNDGVTFHKCTFGNYFKTGIQTKGSYLGGGISDPSSVDPTFVPNKNIDIGYCTFGWNYEPGQHNCAIQFLELPQVETDVNAKIHDNLILMSGEHGMHIYHGNNNLIIENNTVLNSGHGVLEDYYIGGGTIIYGYGIEVTSCHDVIISKNEVANFIASGIVVFDDGWYTDGDIYNIRILNNTITQDSNYSAEFRGNGVTLSHCKKAVVSGNLISNMLQTKNNSTDCCGIGVSYCTDSVIDSNTIESCQKGISLNYCDTIIGSCNIIRSLTNSFGESCAIDNWHVDNCTYSNNRILRGESVLTGYDGIRLTYVTNAVVSGNALNDIRRGILDGSGTVTNAAVYGNVFSGLSGNKYLWWGTHTDLVVDFTAVANN